MGYGSDLRGDDAAGRQVAAAIEATALDGVVVRSVVQLTPELALDIAGKDVVVFVDASVDVEEVTVRAVAASPAAGVMTHHGDPATLLSHVPSVGHPPQHAYVVSIPAASFDLGAELGERATRAVDEAVDIVTRIVTDTAAH